jgi:hypothetical protein
VGHFLTRDVRAAHADELRALADRADEQAQLNGLTRR